MSGHNVYLFVFDGLADWEIGHVTAGINTHHWQKIPDRYDLRTVAAHTTPITTAGGLRVVPDMSLESLYPDTAALLILPGGTAWEQGGNGKALERAREFLAANVPVAAICAAVFALARVGLLEGVRHTGNSAAYLAASGYSSADLYDSSVLAKTDGNVITAAGTAPVDFAREVFARLDLYEPAVLDAWHGLFKTGRAEYFDSLVAASQR